VAGNSVLGRTRVRFLREQGEADRIPIVARTVPYSTSASSTVLSRGLLRSDSVQPDFIRHARSAQQKRGLPARRIKSSSLEVRGSAPRGAPHGRGALFYTRAAPLCRLALITGWATSPPVYSSAHRGGFRGAGGRSTDAKTAAHIDRGFRPKNHSAAVVPPALVRKNWCAVRHARFLVTPARWGVGLQTVSDGGESCGSPRPG